MPTSLTDGHLTTALLGLAVSAALSLSIAGCAGGSASPTGNIAALPPVAVTPAPDTAVTPGDLNLPAPRDLYRLAATLKTSRHLPAVQCESLSFTYQKITFDNVARKALFQPTGSGLGEAAYIILPFPTGDLDPGVTDLAFTLDGTRSQDDGTLRCFVGVADYSRNVWDWEVEAESSAVVIHKRFDKASPMLAQVICVAFVGGGVFDADSFDLRPLDSRWPAEQIASWTVPDTSQTHTYARWNNDPYAEDAMRCFYVDTSTDQLMTGALDQGAWRTTPSTSFGDKVRSFSQCGFGDGSVRVAYFDADKFQLKVLKGDRSYAPGNFILEYATAAGGGTPLNNSSVDMIEEPVTHTPRLVFHDEGIGGLRFAEPGPLPGELAVSIISDTATIGRKQKMWLTSNFRCVASDDTAGSEGIVQFDFDAALGWTPTPYDLSAMPFTSPPGVMDAVNLQDNSLFVAYSCPHGLGLVEWQDDTKSGNKVVSKTYMVPHILESRGSITKGRIKLDSNGQPVVVALSPLTNALSLAQWDPLASQWFTEPITTLAEGTDCDDVDLYVEPDTDGDGFVDAGVLTACREAASQPATFKWVLEVRVDRIEMK